jgi:hypothetical protein
VFADGGIQNVVIRITTTTTRKITSENHHRKTLLYKINNKTPRLNYRPIENRTVYDFSDPQQKSLEFAGSLNTDYYWEENFFQESVMVNKFMEWKSEGD